MGVLQNHKKKDVRFQKGDLIIYEPNEIQYNEIVKIIEDNVVTNNNLDAKGELGIQPIRYLIRELTSIGSEIDEMSDTELNIAFDNGDRELVLFIRELTTLINEITEDIQYKQYELIDTMSKIFSILNSQESEIDMKNKFNRLCKRKGINMTFDEFIELQNNPEELQKRMNPTKNKKKKK